MLISGAGIACLDYLYIAPETPRGGSAPISDFLIQGGGLVGTALVTCARLGAQAALYARIGNDEVGESILRELRAEGVDVENVQLHPEVSSPFSFIHVDEKTGERTIFFHSAHNIPSTIQHPDLRTVTLSNAVLVDDSRMDLSLAVASVAKANGIPVVGDMLPNSRNTELLECVDALIVPRFILESEGVQGDIDRALYAIHSYGPSIAVITLGEHGWIYSSPDGKGRGDAFSVDVVDTTGAGDVFHGAFAFGMASGWDVRRCCEFSAAVAALKCTRMGGRTGIPSYQSAMAFLASRAGWSDKSDRPDQTALPD